MDVSCTRLQLRLLLTAPPRLPGSDAQLPRSVAGAGCKPSPHDWPLLPFPSNAGNPDTLNWLFAGDRDALRAMVSLMRSADMDAARLGLQVGLRHRALRLQAASPGCGEREVP